MPQQQWSGKHVKEDPLDEFYNPDGSLKDIPGLGGRRPPAESLDIIMEHSRKSAEEVLQDQAQVEAHGRTYVLAQLLKEAYERIELLENQMRTVY